MKFIILFVVVILSSSVFSEVITPSFDPSRHTVLPSASVLKNTTSFAARYFKSSGEEKSSDTTAIRTGTIDGDISGISLNAKSNLGESAAEFKFERSSHIRNIPDEENETDKTTTSELKLNLATGTYLGAYWGATYFSKGEKVDLFGQTITTRGLGIGANYLWSTNFILGAGLNYVSNTDTLRVDNKWIERIIGFTWVSPGETGYQFEVAWTHSPRSKKKAEGDVGVGKTVNHHPKTDRFDINFELLLSDLFFAATYVTQKEEAPSQNTKDQELTKMSVGAGMYWGGKQTLTSVYLTKVEEESSDAADSSEYTEITLRASLEF